MRTEKMHRLVDTAGYVFEELTDGYSDRELGRAFWAYLRSKLLDDATRKVKVSEFVCEQIRGLDEDVFEKKYGVKLSNVKKSRQQLSFVAETATKMLKFSGRFEIIDW